MIGAGGSGDAGGSGAWIAPVADDGGFARFLETVWAGRWIVLVAVLCAAVGALVYVESAQKVYKAHSQLLVTPVPNDPTTAGLGLIHDTSDPLRDVETGAGFVTDANVAQLVLQRLGLHESTTQLLSQITVTPIAESDIVDIAASSSSPARARAIASAFATATVDNRTARLHDQLAVLIPRLSTQLAALPSSDAAAKAALGSQLAELDTLSLEPDPTVRVESLASTPTSPTSPRKALTLVAAVFAGLVAGIGLVFGVLLLDPRLRREDQLHRFRLPVLARIPRSKKRRRRPGSPEPITPDAISPESADAFRALRSVLGAGGRASAGGRARSAGRARGSGRVVFVTGSCPLDGQDDDCDQPGCDARGVPAASDADRSGPAPPEHRVRPRPRCRSEHREHHVRPFPASGCRPHHHLGASPAATAAGERESRRRPSPGAPRVRADTG